MNERIAQESKKLFAAGYYCSESVLKAIAKAKGIQSELIPRIATGFGAGLSRTNGTCGAVSGGILAINLFFGRMTAEESLEKNFALVQEFLGQFEARFGSINCFKLTDCDLSTDAGREKFDAENLEIRCAEITGEAARIALALIEENQ